MMPRTLVYWCQEQHGKKTEQTCVDIRHDAQDTGILVHTQLPGTACKKTEQTSVDIRHDAQDTGVLVHTQLPGTMCQKNEQTLISDMMPRTLAYWCTLSCQEQHAKKLNKKVLISDMIPRRLAYWCI